MVDRLRIFCTVAEKKSFAQAAIQLGLARSNVTYTIKSLEKEYEILLFYRTTRQVALTHEGNLFYTEAQRLITQLKEFDLFKTHLRNQDCKISIGIPNRLATQLLIPYLHEFYQKCPNVKVIINANDDFSDLIDQQLDCVVRVGQVHNNYLLMRPICQTKICTLASPAYIKKFGEPKTLDDLKFHYVVNYNIKKRHQVFSELFFQNQTVKVPYRLLVENTETYLHAGLAGMGIIQIPEFDAIKYLQQGKLCLILENYQKLELPINLLMTDKKYRPEYFQDFIDWIHQLFKNNLHNCI